LFFIDKNFEMFEQDSFLLLILFENKVISNEVERKTLIKKGDVR